jgi:trimethylamine--corrinoid protein Co-methyltransferase
MQPIEPFVTNLCVNSLGTMATVERIHENALRIASEVGVRIKHEESRDILYRQGARVEEDRVFFPPGLVQQSLLQAPTSFSLHGADPFKTVTIGGENRVFYPGFGAPAVTDWTGVKRDATLDDYIKFTKMTQACGAMGMNGGLLVQINDYPARFSHLIMMYAALMLSDQPMLGIGGGSQIAGEVCDLVDIRLGDNPQAKGKAGVLFMVGTTSPLQLDSDVAETSITALRQGQALIISAAPGQGITGPIELAANLSMATAENMAMITLCQAVSPGCRLIYGMQCYGGDLRIGNVSVGGPAYALQSRFNAALARKYGMPSRGGGMTADAPAVTAQAGLEGMLNLTASWSHGINLVVHAAGIMDRFASMSYEKYVLDLEGIRLMGALYGSLDADNDDDLAFELIAQVGPGGSFLTSRDTFEKVRTHSWQSIFKPKVAPGHTANETLYEALNKQVEELIAGYQAPEISPEIIQAMDDYLLDRGVDAAVLEQIKAARGIPQTS